MSRVILASAMVLALAGCGIFRGGDKPKTPTVGERLAVLTYDTKVEADPELATLTVTLPPPEANAAWAQPGGSADRALGHLAIGQTVAKAWSVSIGEGSSRTRKLVAAPVVADGKIFTIDVNATVRAFDVSNGRELWAARIAKDGEKASVAFGGGVSFDNGRVFATSGYGLVAAFDANSGAQAWRVDLKTPLRGAPSIDEGRVFVVSQDNQLTALSAEKGETLWDAVGTVESTALLGASAPAISQGTAVVGFSSGELTAMRVENGRAVWQDALARTGRTTALAALTDIDAPVVIDRGRVFAVGHGGRIAALELTTGQRAWERSLAGVSKPWVAGDFIYVVTIDGELLCLTRGEGRVKWVTQLPRWRDEDDRKGPIRWAGPVLASDRLIVTSSNGQMISASPYTGELMSTVKIGEAAYLGPVVAANTVFVLTDDGTLTAYR